MSLAQPRSERTSSGRSEGRLKRLARVVTLAAPAVVLMLAGVSKLFGPFLAGYFISFALRIPLRHAVPVAMGLGAAEVALGFTCLLMLGVSRVPALFAAGLYSLFTGMLLRVLMVDPRATTCGCFGDLFGGVGQHHLQIQVAFDMGMVTLLIVHMLLTRKPRTTARPELRQFP